MAENKTNNSKKPPFPIALIVSFVIVLCLAAIVLGSENKFGIISGWMVPMVLAIFMGSAVPKEGITPKSVASVLLGSAFAIIAGQFFVLFTPVFVICAVVTIACVITKKATLVLNDYALIVITAYTIKGVPDISRVGQDYLMLGVVAVILIVICAIFTKVAGSKPERKPGEAKAFDGRLSKDLPDEMVEIPEELKQKSYYKYVQQPIKPVSEELKNRIISSKFKVGEGLEIEDRAKLQEEDPYPLLDGVYPLKNGGVMTCANVKTPDLTGEMLGWWASWHGVDPLRYAIWDREDHYDLKIIKNSERLLDESIPAGERVIGTKHSILESFDRDEPSNLNMEFVSPWDVGYDPALGGTERHMYMVCAKADMMGGKIPVFASEVLVKGKDGINEMRCRFWIGYEVQDDGRIVCKLPKFFRPPKKIVEQVVIHNHKEFTRLNEVLPALYAEYSTKPFDVD